MQIKVNGKQMESVAPISLTQLLKTFDITPSTGMVAVALNECIVYREEWKSIMVKEDDRIEIIHAVQGG
jgi:sulfur carrier protein